MLGIVEMDPIRVNSNSTIKINYTVFIPSGNGLGVEVGLGQIIQNGIGPLP